MTDLLVFILFVLGGNGGFNPADVPDEHRLTDKFGPTMTAAEVESALIGPSYDYWKASAILNQKQALDGGIQDFIVP